MNKTVNILLNASSGIGKDTIKDMILKNSDVVYCISTTTRLKRQNEEEGVTYHFLTPKEFIDKTQNQEMIEVDYFDGNYYGYEKRESNKGAKQLWIVAGQGLLELKKHLLSKDQKVKIIGLTLNEEEQRQRMILRGDKPENVERRIKANKRFENDLQHADIIIENKNSLDTMKEILEEFKAWK